MTDKGTSASRDSGAPERIRRQDGGGERDPLPASEANRANQAPSEADEDAEPGEREPTRSAIDARLRRGPCPRAAIPAVWCAAARGLISRGNPRG